ncbi:Barstar, RNAse (barnase) inhibitor [Leptolyngbyaceae cyanobacterium JSC-12]|nr:Barstar, RNAse (barnase) inhibitor [Leptolyngbyaceae cyanobacterium JSC-12]
MNNILATLQGDREPGIYTITGDLALDELIAACEERHFKLFVIEGDRIASKSDFLRESSQVMNFPDYFGANWDGFEECLTDLEWLPANGYVVLYLHPEHFATAQPDDWAVLISILRSAVEQWKDTESPLFVFLQPHPSSSIEFEKL